MRSQGRVGQAVSELDGAQKLGLFLPLSSRLVDLLFLENLTKEEKEKKIDNIRVTMTCTAPVLH